MNAVECSNRGNRVPYMSPSKVRNLVATLPMPHRLCGMSALVLLFYLPGYETFRREEMPPERIRVRFILWNIFIEILKLLNMREWLIL